MFSEAWTKKTKNHSELTRLWSITVTTKLRRNSWWIQPSSKKQNSLNSRAAASHTLNDWFHSYDQGIWSKNKFVRQSVSTVRSQTCNSRHFSIEIESNKDDMSVIAKINGNICFRWPSAVPIRLTRTVAYDRVANWPKVWQIPWRKNWTRLLSDSMPSGYTKIALAISYSGAILWNSLPVVGRP